MVHDFGHMHWQMKKTSQRVSVDIDASLSFLDADDRNSPALYSTADLGFHFDPVYAYEVIRQYPDNVLWLVPKGMQAAFHLINVKVIGDPNGRMIPSS